MTDVPAPNAASIIEQALALPEEERDAFISAACADDRALRDSVRVILAARAAARQFSPSLAELAGADAAARAGGGLPIAADAAPPAAPGHTGRERAPADGTDAASSYNILSAAHGLDAVTLLEAPGASIGPYALIRVLGEGGFGRVFLAEQQKPVRRRVALKIIRLGMDTRSVIARFEAERQALALMDHPGIAKVFDAGATITGRPYFVMELVEGVPITRFCDTMRMDVRARLALFRKVCHAVQHAHQKGVIHRDIKPSNILVAQQDGEPVPKVIDFGIAKATHARLAEQTIVTARQMFIGTPQYMSPEQADLSRADADVDTRTDVYALGILLYELLTGTTPLGTSPLHQMAVPEMQRLICDVPAQRPSSRLSELGERLPDVAAARSAGPERMTRTIRGDLDWIVLKALEKDRNRRYDSAAALAADIGRFLANQPVEATPPTTTYRLRKFVQRNRRAVLAAGAVMAALVLGLVGTTTFAVVAAMRAEHSLAVERFLKGLFGASDPTVADAEGAGPAALLDEARRLFSGDVGAANQIMLSYAARLRIAGRTEPAVSILEDALARPNGVRGTSDEAGVRMLLALLHSDQGQHAEAADEAARAVELVRAANPGSWKEGIAMRQLGEILVAADRPEEAFHALRRAAETLELASASQAATPSPPSSPAIASTATVESIAARAAAAAVLEGALARDAVVGPAARESFLRTSAERAELVAPRSMARMRIERALGAFLLRHGGPEAGPEACRRIRDAIDISRDLLAPNPRARAQVIVEVLPGVRNAGCLDDATALADELLALSQDLPDDDPLHDRLYPIAKSVYERIDAGPRRDAARSAVVASLELWHRWSTRSRGATAPRTLDVALLYAETLPHCVDGDEPLLKALSIADAVADATAADSESDRGRHLRALALLASLRGLWTDRRRDGSLELETEQAYRRLIDERIRHGTAVEAVRDASNFFHWCEQHDRLASAGSAMLAAIQAACGDGAVPTLATTECIRRAIRSYGGTAPAEAERRLGVEAALCFARGRRSDRTLGPGDLGRELIEIADWLIWLEAFADAHGLAAEAWSVLRTGGAPELLQAECLLRMGHCLARMGQPQEALATVGRALESIQSLGDAAGAVLLELLVERASQVEDGWPGSEESAAATRELAAAISRFEPRSLEPGMEGALDRGRALLAQEP